MSYIEMTLDQLAQRNENLMEQKQEILAEQRQIKSIIEKKIAERKAQETFAAMSDTEKEALRQTVMASGIESKEQVQGIQ